MADQDIVRTITIRGKPDGISAMTDQLTKLADAQGNYVRVSDKTNSSLDQIERAWQKQSLRLDEVARAQNKMAQEMQIAQRALDAGKISAQDYATRLDLINSKYGAAANGTSGFAKALTGVQGQLVALSAGAGPVGTLLAGFGPWGLAAAAGLGLATSALNYLSDAAHRAGDKSVELARFSETTGLTVVQIKGLTRAAAENGVQAQETISSIEKFTVAWEELRNGGGSLLDQIRKVDSGLADEMQRTRDSAVAFDLLAQAIRRADDAGNVSQRNALARAAGGRGGINALVGVSSAVSNAGGLNNLADSTGGYTDTMVAKLKVLSTQIEETNKRAQSLTDMIGAQRTLEAELAWAKMKLRIAETSAALADAEKSKPFWSWLFEKLAATSEGGNGIVEQAEALARGLAQPALNQSPEYPPKLYGMPQPPAGPKTPQAIAADWKDYISALGNAATANDRLKARQAELFSQLEGGKITVETYNKAMAGESFATSSAALNARIGLLGEAATETDLLRQAENRVIEARKQGATFTPAEIDNMKRLTIERARGVDQMKAQIDAYNVEAATLGMTVGRAAEYAAVQNKINEAQRAGKTITPEMRADWDAYGAALGRAAQRTDDLKFEYDVFSGTMRDFGANIRNGQTAMEAFGNAGRNALGKIADRLMDMASKQLWNAAFPTGGAGIFSLFGGSGWANPDKTGASANFSGAWYNNAQGGVYGPGVLQNYANTVVSSPTFFRFAQGGAFGSLGQMGEAGSEAIMPLKRGPDGSLGVRASVAQGQSVAPQINVTNNFPSNADPAFRAEMIARIDASMKQAVASSVQAVARTKQNNPNYLRN